MPRTPANVPEAKSCDHCGTTFTRDNSPSLRYRAARWTAQRYCSRECSRAARAERETLDTDTKTCITCGKPFTRPRYKNGRLQGATDWSARKVCSVRCKTKYQTNDENAKTCACCGKSFHRGRHPSGKIQSSAAWQKQTACSRTCASRLRAHESIPPKPKRQPKQHPPCRQCGNPVERRDSERATHWHKRKYCTTDCGRIALAESRARLARERRIARLAPKRYVFNGRFPTPASVTGWTSVAGSDTGVRVSFARNNVTRSPRTMRMLARAFGQHPDLLAALAGILSDSWVQQDSAG